MNNGYTLTLSNGTQLETLYPLEVLSDTYYSTPRKIKDIVDLGGSPQQGKFVLFGDVTFPEGSPAVGTRFQPGDSFRVENPTNPSDPNIGTWIVQTVTVNSNGNTEITVTGSLNTGLPYGNISYKVPVAVTSLNIPGRGYINYGEIVAENMLWLLENFASATAPSNPVEGQFWWNTTEQSLYINKSTGWESGFNIGSGELTFVDPQHPTSSTDPIYVLTGDDSDVGVSLQVTTDPSSGDSIFRVLSQSGSESLRVEFNGLTTTNNNLSVQGTGNSTFYGSLAVGGNGAPTPDKTLTVEGNGISVNSNTGTNADLVLNSDSVSNVFFEIGGSQEADITVDGSVAGNPLSINGASSNNVYIASGGGQVGIGTNTPAAGTKLDVAGIFQSTSGNITSNNPNTVLFISNTNAATNEKTWGWSVDSSGVITLQAFPDTGTGVTALSITRTGNTPDNSGFTYVGNTVWHAGNFIPSEKVNVAGDTMTGFLTLSANPTNNLHAATKQYVDQAAGPSSTLGKYFDEFIATGGETVVNTTNVTTQQKTSTTSFQHVFLNGVLQREGEGSPPSGSYIVTGSNQITFNNALSVNDEVLIYQL